VSGFRLRVKLRRTAGALAEAVSRTNAVKAMLVRAALGAALLASSGCGASSSPDSFVHIGTWGGDHALLTVTTTNATIEFDCAHGALSAPIALADGTFDVMGEYFPEHGGPIRVDDPVVRQPARYSGSIDRRTMTLRVRVIEPSQEVGTFTLTLGTSGRVFKCL